MIKKEVLDEVFDIITKENRHDIVTGFKDLDYFLKDTPASSIITVGARPAMGKTSFVVSILLKLLSQGKKCLVFLSNESEIMFIKRLILQIENLNNLLLKDKEQLNKKYNENIKNALNKIAAYNLTINDKYSDLTDIKEQVESEKSDYVFIDYLDGIKANINDKFLSELKQIPKDNNCILFLVTGLTRSVENRKNHMPVLSDMRNAKIISNISDVIMFIYRDAYYGCNQDCNLESDKDADIIVAKNKCGPTGIVRLKFNHLTTRFSDYS